MKSVESEEEEYNERLDSGMRIRKITQQRRRKRKKKTTKDWKGDTESGQTWQSVRAMENVDERLDRGIWNQEREGKKLYNETAQNEVDKEKEEQRHGKQRRRKASVDLGFRPTQTAAAELNRMKSRSKRIDHSGTEPGRTKQNKKREEEGKKRGTGRGSGRGDQYQVQEQ
ncbi:hypothetical protein OUZ56_032309, partial [Daphnia magna]